MKNKFLAALIIFLFIPFLSAFGQDNRYSNEQLQTRLDSLYQLEREARMIGEENKYVAEIKQLQTLIKTERERIDEENLKGENVTTAVLEDTNEITDFLSKITDFMAGNKLLDNLIIVMGVIAILAAVFLIFIRLFLAISPKKKKSAVKKKVLTKKANVSKEIDRDKEKAAAAQKAQISKNITYSLRELANQNTLKDRQEILEKDTPKIEEPPKKMTPAEQLKNEIFKKFDAGEDIAKIARDFDVSQDQIAMILRLSGRK